MEPPINEILGFSCGSLLGVVDVMTMASDTDVKISVTYAFRKFNGANQNPVIRR